MLYQIHHPDITQSVRHADIPLQSTLGHTTNDNENSLNCQMNQLIDMESPQ